MVRPVNGFDEERMMSFVSLRKRSFVQVQCHWSLRLTLEQSAAPRINRLKESPDKGAYETGTGALGGN
jgi:hypothetical protein